MVMIVTNHCEKRFFKRVAKTSRSAETILQAQRYGVPAEQVRCGELRKSLIWKENEHGSKAKVYKNSVYWFIDNRAITVYPLAQKYHGRI